MARRLDRRRSLTAEGAAFARAAGLRHIGVPDEALESLLPAFARLVLRAGWTRRGALRLVDRIAPGMPGYHLARTRFFDERLAHALGAGAQQVVLLCAGLDTRAHRLRRILAGATVFEVDHPQTSTWKQARVARLAGGPHAHPTVRYVACDLRVDALGDCLRAAGLERKVPTFVIWEGATMYLESVCVARTLRELAGVADLISVAFDYLDRQALETPGSFPGAQRNLDVVARRGEPYVFGLSPGQVDAFVAAAGFVLGVNHEARAWGDTRPGHLPTLGFAGLAEAHKAAER